MLLCRYTNSTRLVGVSGGRVGVATSMAGGGTALSVLTISSVHLADRGNYTCKPASGGHASVSLHVLEGDHTKASNKPSRRLKLKVPTSTFTLNALC